MEGVGIIESQDTTVGDRFQVFQSLDCPKLGYEKNEWRTASPPTCQCESGLSVADYFGRTMIDSLPGHISIGIVQVAVGGCDIRLFDKDIYQGYDSTYTEDWFTNKIKYYNGNPYEFLINKVALAQQYGTIKGILLHQGETNTGDTLWPVYVQKIYTDIITDLDLNTDDIPLLAGELVSVDSSCCKAMNPIINTLPTFIPNAYVISSDGCGAMDHAHFNSEGYREMGRRYAQKMIAVRAE